MKKPRNLRRLLPLLSELIAKLYVKAGLDAAASTDGPAGPAEQTHTEKVSVASKGG